MITIITDTEKAKEILEDGKKAEKELSRRFPPTKPSDYQEGIERIFNIQPTSSGEKDEKS